MIGRRVAHYTILAELGSGGMGTVYRARDEKLGREVALKMLPPPVADDRIRLQRFRTEARAVAALSHPNIVTLYAVEEADRLCFLTMELVEGRTLDQVTPARGLDLERFFRLAIDLADAVAAAHEKGVVHRDLKPGNVMVDVRGRLKVLDFGLAKLLADPLSGLAEADAPTEEKTRPGHLLGTPAFMSPEQIRTGPVDHRSDIFSLGLVLYLMATGRHPFAARTHADVTSGILRDAPAPASRVRQELPEELGRIIGMALEKDPERRFQSAKDLRDRLAALRQELESPRAAPAPRRWPTRAARWAILAAVLALAATAAVWRLRPATGPAAPAFLAVARVADAEAEPDRLSTALPELLEWRLGAARGLYAIGEQQDPRAALVLGVDSRAVGERLRVSYRLRDRSADRELGGTIVEGDRSELFDLVDRIGRDVTALAARELGASVRFDPPAAPTQNVEALELFVEGVDRLRRGSASSEVESARGLFERALERDPAFALARAFAGKAILTAYRLGPERALAERALAACTEALRLDGGLAEAHVCVGDSLSHLDRPLETIESYRSAIAARATLIEAYDGIRAAHRVLRNPDEELRSWRRVVELRPGFWAGHFYLGGFHSRAGDYEAAIEAYRRALELGPDNARAYVSLGGSYYFLGRWEEAVQALQRSIHVRPTFEGYSNLGSTYFILRRFDEAITAFEHAAEFEAADFPAYGNLARAYYWSGSRRQRAADTFRRAARMSEARLTVQPDDPDALLLLAYYRAMLGDAAGSLATLDRALRARPDDPHGFYLAGVIHGRLGRREIALDWLERAARAGYSLAEIRNTIELDDLRAETRFSALLDTGSRG